MPASEPRFACTQCARCCRNLLETKTKGLPSDAEALSGVGIRQRERVGGLMAWAWEVEQMSQAARERGVALDFRPVTEVTLRTGDVVTAVALIYELQSNECPLVARSNLCGAYDARPVVCRAYPLLLTGGRAVTVSTKCPGHVLPTAAGLGFAYGPAARAVAWAHAIPRVAFAFLHFLETSGRVRIERGEGRSDVERSGVAPTNLMDFLRGLDCEAAFLEHLARAQAATEGAPT